MTPFKRSATAKFWMLSKILRSAWFRWFVTLVLIGILANRLDTARIFRRIEKFDASYGLIMLAVNVALIFVFAKRWHSIAASLKLDLCYRELVEAIWLAVFLGQFGPTLLIAEATRFGMLRKHGPARLLITSQILDRLSGQIVLVLVVLLLLPLSLVYFEISPRDLMAGFCGAIALLLSIRFLYPRIRNQFDEPTREALELLGRSVFAGHYAWSLLVQVMLVVNFSLAACGLGLCDRFAPVLVRVPMLFAILGLVPITISDWGSRESTAVMLLRSDNLDAESIVSISIVFGLSHLLSSLPGALLLIGKARGAKVRDHT